ncbi:MAG: glycosyltransferase family A protein [Lachnospira sp.]
MDSILKQNYLDFELILINDGSLDNTLEKCSALCSNRR